MAQLWEEESYWYSNRVQSDPLVFEAGLDELAEKAKVQKTLMAVLHAGGQQLGVVQISNNGNPLPIDSDVKHSRRGIYSLLSDLELKFGASTSISRGLDGTGTIVEATFPALPLTDEV